MKHDLLWCLGNQRVVLSDPSKLKIRVPITFNLNLEKWNQDWERQQRLHCQNIVHTSVKPSIETSEVLLTSMLFNRR